MLVRQMARRTTLITDRRRDRYHHQRARVHRRHAPAAAISIARSAAVRVENSASNITVTDGDFTNVALGVQV